jgi:MT0933-like antitoxin protein
MGLMDTIKGWFGGNTDKVKDLAAEHGDKAKAGVDKATDVMDDKTKGKFGDHLDKVDDGVAKGIDEVGGK